MLKTISIIALLLLTACQAYTPQPQLLPQHIRKIAIRQFVNQTTYFGLEDKLTLSVIDEFVRDGRYTVVSENDADGILVGEITHYILQPLTYGPNFEPQQYKLRILLNLYFIDKGENKEDPSDDVTLWEEKALEGLCIYADAASSLPEETKKTEEQAREFIWKDLSQKILTRTVQGFGTVSGISEKKVPKISK
ncbi:MAG: LptE family protein [Elusimicrobiota bacterium]|nr:LptE family protein [Elusimicrobiota bacterium]